MPVSLTVTLTVAALLVTAPSHASPIQHDADRVAEHMERGERLYEFGRYSLALKRFRLAHAAGGGLLAYAAYSRTLAYMRSCRRAAPALAKVLRELGDSPEHRAERPRAKRALSFCRRLNAAAAQARASQTESYQDTATLFYTLGGVGMGLGAVGTLAGGIMLAEDEVIGGILLTTLGVSTFLTGTGLVIRGAVVDPGDAVAITTGRPARARLAGVVVGWRGTF